MWRCCFGVLWVSDGGGGECWWMDWVSEVGLGKMGEGGWCVISGAVEIGV